MKNELFSGEIVLFKKRVSTFLFITLFIFNGCDKEIPPPNDTVVFANSLEGLPKKIKNDRLVFETHQAFLEAVKAINAITDKDLDRWEESIGFNSIRKFITRVRDEYDRLESEQGLTIFLAKYEGKILFDEGTIDHPVIRPRNISALVSDDGWIYVGKNLYKFTNEKQIIIQGGDENKIDLANRLDETDEFSNIFIIHQPNKNKTPEFGRSCNGFCSAYFFYMEDKDSDNDKRLRYWWEGYAIQELIEGSGNFNTSYEYYRKIESRKKSGWIWKRTWINVAFDHSVTFCYPSCNLPEDGVDFDEVVNAVADYEAFTPLLIISDFPASCPLYHITIDTQADRIESPVNTSDLQCRIICD